MLRTSLLAAARSPLARKLVERNPLTKPVVGRFVAGAETPDAVTATRELVESGRAITIDYLGEDTTEVADASHTVKAYTELLSALSDQGLATGADVSVKLSAVGQALPGDGHKIALDNARLIADAAAGVGATLTLDMEDHTTTDSTLDILGELRADFPWVGAVLQAYLYRTEGDARDLSGAGSRVRLCKGAYREPASVAYQDKAEVDRNYVRVLRILMEGQGYPMIASHDPRIIAIAGELGIGRQFEYQMLYGIRPQEQEAIARRGDTMRVYVPYGVQWYGYFMRRLAERPANLAFFLRAMATRG
ncbi:proline dehydrogenase family protein [Kibdelosporangium phytohabitans]|uniref:proline dehydrogenase n=1 Tax=Kibdelosporangium phytohabitans TaxID=860235 RepID=A0A0N9IA38_9PSEU|nr:proline dehydrogenase family protein [Kibdelosporangium phytohabitans]ALG11570.1 proline dehydrogenase [Kibdelosporangium phytohabitans]MBE1462937.1 proline dehydrogenase [Kibdelosporangium phytohabitans]